MSLASKKCEPCEGGTMPLSKAEALQYHEEVKNWTLHKGLVEREFGFKDFKEAMKFVNAVAGLAEQEGHHPDIYIFYNKVKLHLSTHAIGGLSLNDFILAAKIDVLGAS